MPMKKPEPPMFCLPVLCPRSAQTFSKCFDFSAKLLPPAEPFYFKSQRTLVVHQNLLSLPKR